MMENQEDETLVKTPFMCTPPTDFEVTPVQGLRECCLNTGENIQDSLDSIIPPQCNPYPDMTRPTIDVSIGLTLAGVS